MDSKIIEIVPENKTENIATESQPHTGIIRRGNVPQQTSVLFKYEENEDPAYLLKLLNEAIEFIENYPTKKEELEAKFKALKNLDIENNVAGVLNSFETLSGSVAILNEQVSTHGIPANRKVNHDIKGHMDTFIQNIRDNIKKQMLVAQAHIKSMDDEKELWEYEKKGCIEILGKLGYQVDLKNFADSYSMILLDHVHKEAFRGLTQSERIQQGRFLVMNYLNKCLEYDTKQYKIPLEQNKTVESFIKLTMFGFDGTMMRVGTILS